MASPSSKKSISDVAKPGNTPADATSRPVIVKRDSFMKDPMMSNKDVSVPTPEVPTSKPAEAPPAPKKIIKPIEDEPVADSSEEPAAQTEPESETEDKSEDTPSSNENSVSDNAVVDAVLEQANNPDAIAAVDKATEERQALVAKLVNQKKYFVPLATAQHRRNNKIAVISVAALLPIIIGLLLAVDAGVIETGLNLPFDLIK